MARRFFGLMFAILTATLVVGHAQQPEIRAVASPTGQAVKASADTYSVLYSFNDGTPGGTEPAGNLIQGSDGNYYGVGLNGGANMLELCDDGAGCGTVFRMTSSGAVTTLYSFCSQTNCSDGWGPGGVIQGSDGNFYGVTGSGGETDSKCSQGKYGCGVIFKLTPAGEMSTLHVFCSDADCSDGGDPGGNLVQGGDGNFYGMTLSGGNTVPSVCASSPYGGCGTIFKVSPSGAFTTLYTFCSLANCADGIGSEGSLVQGSDGNFYGTAVGGQNNAGIFFKITATGSLTVLHDFCNKSECTDGYAPEASLVEGSDGSFYSMTDVGGVKSQYCTVSVGCGTVFKVTPSGVLSTLYSFCSESNCADGSLPIAGLFLASDGNFYGTTFIGGTNENACNSEACGTVFSITSDGALTALYSFCNEVHCADGFSPNDEIPFQGSTGNIYGTTSLGGSDSLGVLFELTPSSPLAAPVQITLSDPTTTAGTSVTLDWSVLNAFSTTMQQCYAFVQGGATGAGTWTGLQTGALANNIYSGSATITPTAAGTYTYALTCGGIESGFATLTVDASETADLTFTSVTHNLGSVQVGSSTSGVSNYGVKITNTSGAAISATGISLTGSNEFKYQANCPATLAAGAYCEVLFAFAPTSTGTVTASWSIAGLPDGTTFNPSNGGTLTGTGVAANGLNLTTSVHNFGNVTVGTTSPVYGTVLTNSYSFPVTLTYTTSGSTASFPLVTNCGAVLYAGESCNSNFTFTPKATGFVTEMIGVAASYNGNPIAVTSLGQTVTGFTLKGTGQ